MAFFSIITVTKDNLAGLQKTYASLPASNSSLWEWIVIDGASSDGTKTWLETQSGSRFVSEPDGGIYDAMNKGLSMAEGSYIIFLNAGDTLTERDMLTKIHRNAQNNMADILYGDALDDGVYKPARSHHAAHFGLFTHYPAIIFNHKLIQDMQHDTDYLIAADYDFTLRALQKANHVTYLPFAIADFESGGLSQRLTQLGRQEQFQIRRRLGSSLPINITVYCRQFMALMLKQACPPFYWLLRSRGNKHSASPPS